MENDTKTIEERILYRAKHLPNRDRVFCISDFGPCGEYSSVAKTLERLVKKGTLQRISHGIYYLPKYNEKVGRIVPPSLDAAAAAIARSNHWKLLPSTDIALLYFGLSTQVPAKALYLNDHSNAEYQIGKRTITFRKIAPKNFLADTKSAMLFEALRFFGPGNITEKQIRIIRKAFSNSSDRDQLAADIIYAPHWMQHYILEILRV